MRMTLQTQMILQALLREPAKETWGRKIAEETGLMPGTAQPILMRLEAEGWLTSRKEDEALAHAEGRPARR
jgi:PadR family transcriptional regulator PadR